MAVPLSLGPVHHLRLTVTDVDRSRAFYTELLGFQIAMDAPPAADDPYHDLATDLLQGGIVMVNGDLLLGLRPVDAERANDRFDPFRCGLDHLSFAVAGRAEPERRRRRSRSAAWNTAISPSCRRSASRCCRSRTPTGSPLSSPPCCSRPSGPRDTKAHPTEIGWQSEQLLAVGRRTPAQASGWGRSASPLGCPVWEMVCLGRPRGKGRPAATSAATSDSLRPTMRLASRRG
jgi:catechol 2,3-dioxygenase-like lactoylglutathione lyase family enzyme